MPESPVSLLHFTDEVRGRSTPRILQKREAPELLHPLDCSLLSHSSPRLAFLRSGCPWAQRLERSMAYLRRHRAVYRGWDIPPPPVMGTVTNEGGLLTSTDEQPRAGLMSLSSANDTNSGSLNPTHACSCYRDPCMELLRTHARPSLF